jgi:hypothetical protein
MFKTDISKIDVADDSHSGVTRNSLVGGWWPPMPTSGYATKFSISGFSNNELANLLKDSIKTSKKYLK